MNDTFWSSLGRAKRPVSDPHAEAPRLYVPSSVDLSSLRSPEPNTPTAPAYPGTPNVVVYYVEKEDPKSDIAVIDRANNTVTAYFRSNAVNVTFNEDYYREHVWPEENPQTAVDSLFSYDLDNTLVASCVHFVPAESNLDEGSSEHPDYPYYNTVDMGVCLHPQHVSLSDWASTVHSLCQYPSQHDSCSDYGRSEWTALKQTTGHPDRLVLQHNSLGCRLSTYRIVHLDETDSVSIISVHKQQTLESVFEEFFEPSAKEKYGATVSIMDIPAVDPAVPVTFFGSLLATSK